MSNALLHLVYRHSQHRGATKGVLAAIADAIHDGDMVCWGKTKTWAEKCGMSLSTFRRHSCELEVSGELLVWESPNHGNYYAVNPGLEEWNWPDGYTPGHPHGFNRNLRPKRERWTKQHQEALERTRQEHRRSKILDMQRWGA